MSANKPIKTKLGHTFLIMTALSSQLMLANLATAQNATFTKSDLWQEVINHFERTEKIVENEGNIVDAYRLLNQKCDFTLSEQSDSALLIAEAEYWESNYGIELRGGLTTGDIDSGEVDEGGRSYLELSWDVLDNGYKEFEYRALDLKRRAALESLTADLNRTAHEYRCRNFQIGNAFIAVDAALSSNKLDIMERVYQIENQAYFNGDAYLDELLISEEAIVQLSRRLERLNSSHQLNRLGFEMTNPPAIDINIESLVQAVEEDPRFKSVLGLERQRASAINPYQNGKRLRFFLRKEFDILASDRDETVAGVRFSIPLVFEDRPNYQVKVNQLEDEYNLEQWQRIQRIRETYNIFQTQLDRVITQQYRYLRSKEKMNRVINRHSVNEPLVLSAVVARLVNYMDASLELIVAKRSLYERANAVFLSSRVPLSSQFLSAVPVSIKQYRSRPFSRAVYLWSPTFNAVDNERLMLVTKTQGFNRIYVSFSKNSDKEKLDSLYRIAEKRGISIEPMLSNNELFRPDRHLQAAAQVAAISQFSDSIHLDIEPQATDGYAQNKALYQQDFVNMLRVIKAQVPDIELSAALPFHWDLTTYSKAEPFLDQVVIMNYENNKADTLTRRMKRILTEIPLSKIAMAVRPKDFDSQFHMEEVLAVVNQATGIENFAFHKLSDVMNLEEVRQ